MICYMPVILIQEIEQIKKSFMITPVLIPRQICYKTQINLIVKEAS